MDNLSIWLAALCVAELMHNAIEIWGMSQKVGWLAAARKGQGHKPWPVNINTKARTVVLHVLILVVAGGGSYLVLKVLSLSISTYLYVGILALLINYVYTTWKVDRFHNQIGSIIAEEKKLSK